MFKIRDLLTELLPGVAVHKEAAMEFLYETFTSMPIQKVGFMGAVQLMAIAAVMIFRLRVPSPKQARKQVRGGLK